MIAEPPITVIEPPRGWRWLDGGELWRYRELIYFLCWRDIKVRYKQTAIGAAWAILQPLVMAAVFTIVFHRMAGLSSGALPYPLFAFAGVLPWMLFSNALASASSSVVSAERMITKVYFPRLAVPLAAVSVALIDFAISTLVLAGMMAYYGVGPSPQFWIAPLAASIGLLAATGLGIFFAALNVKYRDVRIAIPFLVQFGMYATPTVYMDVVSSNSRWAAWLLAVNPVAAPVAAFRAALLGGPLPYVELGIAAVAAVLLFGLGGWYFRSVEDGFADVI